MTAPKTERQYDIDILEAQVFIDAEFDSWLAEFLGVRTAQEFKPKAALPQQAAPVAPPAVPSQPPPVDMAVPEIAEGASYA